MQTNKNCCLGKFEKLTNPKRMIFYHTYIFIFSLLVSLCLTSIFLWTEMSRKKTGLGKLHKKSKLTALFIFLYPIFGLYALSLIVLPMISYIILAFVAFYGSQGTFEIFRDKVMKSALQLSKPTSNVAHRENPPPMKLQRRNKK